MATKDNIPESTSVVSKENCRFVAFDLAGAEENCAKLQRGEREPERFADSAPGQEASGDFRRWTDFSLVNDFRSTEHMPAGKAVQLPGLA